MAFSDLSYLQGLVKSDPETYREEAMKQHKQFLTQYQIFQLKPSKEHKEFSSFIKFLSQVAPCYPTELKAFPGQLAELLEQNALILEPKLRETLVRALVLLRNRNLLSPTSLLSLFFKLFRCPDKNLRQLLRKHIVSDIQKCNSKKQNNELNRTLQNFMYSMLKDTNAQASRESLGVMIELWRRNVWTDGKTINVISTGAFSQDSKVIAMTLNFFLMKDSRLEGDENDEPMTPRQVLQKYGLKNQKKTNKRKRVLSSKLSKAKKEQQKKMKQEADDEAQYNYAAVAGINDPQAYCEKLFNALKATQHGFELKIRMMSFCSRLISAHKLMLDGFYSFLQKYSQPHNQNITQILAILAQSCHPMVSPDVLTPLLHHIANAFVTDRRPVEVIAIGLNTIREMCLRAPLVMNAGLLKDLCSYKKHKDKGVMMSSKSIISLFRAINPGLLPTKERGKGADLTIKPREFGEQPVMSGIEGAEYLDDYSGSISEPDEDALEPQPESESEEDEGDGWEEVSASEISGEWEIEGESVDGEEREEGEQEEQGEEGEEGEDDGDDAGNFETDGETTGASSAWDFDSDDLEMISDPEGEEDEEDEGEEGEEEEGEEDEEGEEGNAEDGEDDPNPAPKKKVRIDSSRILTDEEFQKLRAIKAKKAVADAQNNKERAQVKRKLEHANLLAGITEEVSESDIAGLVKKKQKMDYQTRVKEILDNKEDKRAYSKFRKERKQHSVTNETKAKTTKPFNMVKHKNATKARMSQKQKKNRKAKHVKKMKSQSMSKHF